MSSYAEVESAQELAVPSGADASLSEGAPSEATAPKRGLVRRLLGALVQGTLALAVLGGGAALAVHLLATGPKSERRPPARRAHLVAVEAVALSAQPIRVDAMGAVGPAQVVDLQPRVSGEIVEVSPECVPGGRFGAGATVAKIDEADFKLAVAQQQAEARRLAAQTEQRKSDIQQAESDIKKRESEIVQAEAALAIELGEQAVAKQEYKLLGQSVREEDRELVLRQPQLRAAQAVCDVARAAKKSAEAMKTSAEAAKAAAEAAEAAAEAALKKMQLDLRRTTIKAPFNAIVDSESIDLGSQVSPTTRLARLVGTDEYWVEASVPVDQLKWVRIPRSREEEKTGSTVRVYDEAAWGKTAFREGSVLRLASKLEEQGRMARLLVLVKDPLALEDKNRGKPALLLGSYVRVEIEGQGLESVVAVDRGRLHDGDHVWVMDAEGKLDIREVEVKFRGRDRVLVSGGLKAGERLVTTDLAAPVQGMPLCTRDEAGAASEAEAEGGGRRGDAAEATHP